MADARAYHRLKKRYRLASVLLQTVFFSFFALTRAEPLLGALRDLPMDSFQGRAVFLGLFYLLMQLVFWPIRYLSGWRLEKKFSLLTQNFSGWLADFFKAQVLGLLFFIGSALAFFWAVRTFPEQWWWVLAAATFAFSGFFSSMFPVLILPLFYRSVPIKTDGLVERLQRTLERCGLPKLPIFEIRLGEKTVRANAMLTGFGKTRRALLSDTLLARYEPAEIEMVLAHEAGHDAHRHLFRSLVIEAAVALGSFYVLYRISAGADLASLSLFPVLMLAAHAAGILMLPAGNALSRLHEREADRFALGRYPDLSVFSSLMEKLSLDNLSDPSPGRWEEFFLYTHPSKKNRIAHAERFLGKLLANRRPTD